MVAYHRSMTDPELLKGEVVKLHDCAKFRLLRAKLERKKTGNISMILTQSDKVLTI